MVDMPGEDAPSRYGFQIFRDPRFGIDADHPSAGLVFSPPSGSDELFYALKMRYPILRTLAQRKVQAILDFLSSELQNDSGSFAPITDTATILKPTAHAPVSKKDLEDYLPSTSGSDNQDYTATSPDSASSPPTQFPIPNREARKPVATSTMTPMVADKVVAMENMVSIWRTSDGRAPTRKRRRQMNDGERLQYQRRRKEGACELCKLQKRKCTHQSKTDEFQRPIRHIKTRKPALATPGPEAESPVVRQPPQQEYLNSQTSTAPQLSDVSQTIMRRSNGTTLTTDIDERAPTLTPSAMENSVSDYNNGQTTPPSDDGEKDDVPFDDEQHSEHEHQPPYESCSSTSSEEE